MAPLGSTAFVLHSHIPYVRGSGRWPHGEEWLLEAMAETYVPLLDMLERLDGEGIAYRLCLTLTPVLLEQLSAPEVQEAYIGYTEQRAAAAEEDARRFARKGQPRLEALALAHRAHYRQVRESFQESYAGDLPAAFARLEGQGRLELATSAATHAYLPLLRREESIRLQLRAGISSHRRHLGRRPRAIWLPECAYRPGLERFLDERGLELFFTDVHLLQGGPPRATAAGDAVGPYEWAGALTEGAAGRSGAEREGGTFRPYRVGGSEVSVVSRNPRTAEQVWSAQSGYPGDFEYREFHKRHEASGLQYWRVSGAAVDLGDKGLYRPERAHGRVQDHARHFVETVADQLASYRKAADRPGLLTSCYDTELFGHWWGEGITWLEAVLRRLAANEAVDLTTPLSFVSAHPADDSVDLLEGSWGAGGGHGVWENAQTRWMWRAIHAAEGRLVEAVGSADGTDPSTGGALRQAARELLLMQSSDWPFLITTGQAREYGERRFRVHSARFSSLIEMLAEDRHGPEAVENLWRQDRVFPDLDVGWLADPS